jgi:hypothetical protein
MMQVLGVHMLQFLFAHLEGLQHDLLLLLH